MTSCCWAYRVTGPHYYIKLKTDEDKIVPLDSHKLLAIAGEQSSRANFSELVKCELQLDRMKHHNRPISTPAAASFLRVRLSEALRGEGGAYEVTPMLAGFDAPMSSSDDSPPRTYLFYMDYLGTLQEVPVRLSRVWGAVRDSDAGPQVAS